MGLAVCFPQQSPKFPGKVFKSVRHELSMTGEGNRATSMAIHLGGGLNGSDQYIVPCSNYRRPASDKELVLWVKK